MQKLSKKNFVSRNITLQDYRALSRADRRHYHDEAEELNQQWVENQIEKLQAKWMMVVDGQVVRHGTTLQNFPGHEALLALCEKTGKYPFAFSVRAFLLLKSYSHSIGTQKEKTL